MRLLIALLGTLALGGCAWTQDKPGGGGTAKAGGTASAMQEQGIAVGTVPPQRLEDGECGLFLWTRDAQRRLVFVGRPAQNAGVMVIGGDEVTLNRRAIEGAPAFGAAARERYIVEESDTEVKLRLDFAERRDISGGALVPRGTLRVSRPKGWATVLPVGGLVACEGR